MIKRCLLFIPVLFYSLTSNGFYSLATKNAVLGEISTKDRTNILAAIDNCFTDEYLDDVCAKDALQELVDQDSSSFAFKILNDYNLALMQGNVSDRACRTEEHLQANQLVGHCILMMNYQTLDNLDNDIGFEEYKTCLQGGLGALSFTGNLAVLTHLRSLYNFENLTEDENDTAKFWNKALTRQKDTDQLNLLKSCFGPMPELDNYLDADESDAQDDADDYQDFLEDQQDNNFLPADVDPGDIDEIEY